MHLLSPEPLFIDYLLLVILNQIELKLVALEVPDRSSSLMFQISFMDLMEIYADSLTSCFLNAHLVFALVPTLISHPHN